MDLDESKHRWLALGTAGLLVAMVMFFRFGYAMELPEKPPRPEEVIEDVVQYSRNIARSEGSYDAYLAKDSKSLGLGMAPSRSDMSKTFEYFADETPKVIKVGESMRFGPLEIRALRLKVDGSRKKQLVLEIENKTPNYFAYQIKTSLSINHQICKRMRPMTHNAIGIGPRQTIRRSECIYRESAELSVESVETMLIPELGYLYLSAVQPEKIGLSRRTSAGHKAPVHSFNCQLITSVMIEKGMKRGQITWRDMADFYARHRCSTYSFPLGYTAFKRNNERSLPAVESN